MSRGSFFTAAAVRNALCGGIALAIAGIGSAHATALQSLQFSGILQYGYDGSGLFGGSNAALDGQTYSITFTYDAAAFTQSYASDSCGALPGTSCYFSFTAANAPTEIVTINGHTQTFVGNAGGIGFTAGAHDDININVQGPNGLSFSGDFKDGTSFFANQSNVNNPNLTSFTNIALSSGTWNSSVGSTSFGANPMQLTANPGAVVPEPMSLGLVGIGVVGLAAVRRRKGTTVKA